MLHVADPCVYWQVRHVCVVGCVLVLQVVLIVGSRYLRRPLLWQQHVRLKSFCAAVVQKTPNEPARHMLRDLVYGRSERHHATKGQCLRVRHPGGGDARLRSRFLGEKKIVFCVSAAIGNVGRRLTVESHEEDASR